MLLSSAPDDFTPVTMGQPLAQRNAHKRAQRFSFAYLFSKIYRMMYWLLFQYDSDTVGEGALLCILLSAQGDVMYRFLFNRQAGGWTSGRRGGPLTGGIRKQGARRFSFSHTSTARLVILHWLDPFSSVVCSTPRNRAAIDTVSAMRGPRHPTRGSLLLPSVQTPTDVYRQLSTAATAAPDG